MKDSDILERLMKIINKFDKILEENKMKKKLLK